MNALNRSPSPIPAARSAAATATSTSKFESLPEELQCLVFDYFETVSQLQPLRLVSRAFCQRSEPLLAEKKSKRDMAQQNIEPYLAAYLALHIERSGVGVMLEQANNAFAALQESGGALEKLSIDCLDQNSFLSAHVASQVGLSQSAALIKLFELCSNVVELKLADRVLSAHAFKYFDISPLKQLQRLDLSFNIVGDEFFETALKGGITSLTSFVCPNGLVLTDRGAASFVEFVARQVKLKNLHVSVADKPPMRQAAAVTADLRTLASQGHGALQVLRLECKVHANFWENFDQQLFPSLESLFVACSE